MFVELLGQKATCDGINLLSIRYNAESTHAAQHTQRAQRDKLKNSPQEWASLLILALLPLRRLRQLRLLGTFLCRLRQTYANTLRCVRRIESNLELTS